MILVNSESFGYCLLERLDGYWWGEGNQVLEVKEPEKGPIISVHRRVMECLTSAIA